MATSTSILCGICDARHVTTCAEHWCPECEEGLCAECLEHHSLSKASRKHEVISIENYKKLPEFILDVRDSCKEHGLKFTNYCQHHDQLCCPGCININHKKCEDLQPLADLFKNSKNSALISFLDERLAEMLTFIAQGVKYKTQNISYLGKQQQSIRDEITQIRSKINSNLDTLERFMIKNVTDIHTKTTTDIKAKVNQLSEKSKEIKKLKDNLFAFKEYGSDLQTFFGARRLKDEVNKEATYFKSTFDYKYFNLMKIVGTIDQKVIDILGLKSFGKVDVETGPSLKFKAREEKEAQIKTEVNPVPYKTINDLQLKLLSSFNIPRGKKSSSMSGCTVTANGKMIFIDENNQRLVIFNFDNSYDKVIRLLNGCRSRDVTVIDEQTVAVSTGEGIKIIDVGKEQIKKSIKTCQPCSGISFDGDSLLWFENKGDIKKMALHDGKISTIVQRQFRGLYADYFVASYGDKIYLGDCYDNTVESFTSDGKSEWKFKDSSILFHPQRITVDNDMRVYTTTRYTNHVVVISPDGKQGRQLLSKEDGIDNPTGICFDRARNNLLITNKNGTVFLYHVE